MHANASPSCLSQRLSAPACLPHHDHPPPSPPTLPPSVSPLNRPASYPGDVGSDDDWHCTMASNSDQDNPHPTPFPPSSESESCHDPNPNLTANQHYPQEHRCAGEDADEHDKYDDDDMDDSEQQCILIPNYRGVARSPALPDRAAHSANTASPAPRRPSPGAPDQQHASKNVLFDVPMPQGNIASAASSLSVTSSFSTSLPMHDELSDSSKTPQYSLQRPTTPTISTSKSRLSSTMQHLRKGTSSENNVEQRGVNSLPESLSNVNITYSSSMPSTTCTSQPSSAMRGRSPTTSASAAPTSPPPLPSLSLNSDRPASPAELSQPLHQTAATHVFSLYASPLAGRSLSPRNYHPAPVPTSKTMSFLECVLEMLKGATIHKRRTFMHHPRIYLWLTPDLCELRYRHSKKGNMPLTERISLCRVSKLKGSEREVSMEFSDAQKRVEFLFPSKSSADIWLSGLCCLIPAYATVKSRDRLVRQRENYDPLTDSWNGKKVESRKRIVDYILLGTIGRGSFGKVKLALSVQNRQFYAVKVLSKAMMRRRMRSIPMNGVYVNTSKDGKHLDAKDVNEIQVMEYLCHENVMQYIGVYNDTEDDRFYIVLEFVARGPIMSSAKLKGADPLSTDRARRAFIDVLAGLEYLHHMNIAHRDIKPDNLLEAGDGTVKISDFGAAVKCTPASRGIASSDHPTAGTPAFTAPEVAISDDAPKHAVNLFKADMWSLGATLYYMIYGQAPFIAGSVFEMYDTICTEELSFPSHSDASSDVRSLISSLLTKNPMDRADIAQCLRSPWISRCAAIAEKVESIWDAIEKHGGRTDRPAVQTSSRSSLGAAGGRSSRNWYKQS